MFGLWLFLHLTGLAIWIGSLLAIVVILLLLKKQLGSQQSNALAKRVIRVFGMLAHPASVIVLISGVFMIVQMDLGSTDKPLWLDVMEKGGGMIVLLALVLTGFLGSKAKKWLNDPKSKSVNLTGYLMTLSGFMIMIMAVLLVVSLRL